MAAHAKEIVNGQNKQEEREGEYTEVSSKCVFHIFQRSRICFEIFFVLFLMYLSDLCI